MPFDNYVLPKVAQTFYLLIIYKQNKHFDRFS